MYKAFVATGGLGVAYEKTKTTGGIDVSDLHRVQGQTGTPTQEDNYENLAKAIIVYNTNSEWMLKKSIPYMLKHYNHAGTNGTNNETDSHCYSCKYSMNVRKAWLGENNLRQYIWVGERGVDLNADGDTLDIIPGDPTATPPISERNEATEAKWCFSYGEKEWVSGTLFQTAKEQTERFIYNRERTGDTNYKADCP